MTYYKPGDTSISARDLNRLLALADAKALGQTAGKGSGADLHGGVLIKVKNEEEEDWRMGEVVEVRPYALNDESIEQGFRWFSARTPGVYCSYGYPVGGWSDPRQNPRTIAVLKEPIAVGSIGVAQIGGMAPVLIDIQSTDDQGGRLDYSRVLLGFGAFWHAGIVAPESVSEGETLCLCWLSPSGGWMGESADHAYAAYSPDEMWAEDGD